MPVSEIPANSGNDAGVHNARLLGQASKHKFTGLLIQLKLSEFFNLALTPELTVLPITPAIASFIPSLEADGFHKDPADQIIVATALVHDLRLISNDTRIRQWNGVPMLWRTSRN